MQFQARSTKRWRAVLSKGTAHCQTVAQNGSVLILIALFVRGRETQLRSVRGGYLEFPFICVSELVLDTALYGSHPAHLLLQLFLGMTVRLIHWPSSFP